MHRMYLPSLPAASGIDLIVAGEEGRHAARVKRVAVGEAVRLLDGLGGVADGVVGGVERVGPEREWAVRVRVDRVERVPPVAPGVEVWSACPKPGLLEQMIDGLSQVGAAGWRPLRAARSVEHGGVRAERLERIAGEAGKQCGRAWFLELGPPLSVRDALTGACVVLADAGGGAYEARPAAERITVLVGPEGGWAPEELAAAAASGARICRFGPHAMRVETAAVVAAAVVLDRHGAR